jgi:NADH-quinone oxidoreductase subunit L
LPVVADEINIQGPKMIQYAWLIPVAPALSFLAIVLLFRRSKALSAGLSILTMGGCLAFSIGILLDVLKAGDSFQAPLLSWTWLEVGDWKSNVGVLIDPLSINMLLVVTLVSLLVQIYSLGYMHEDERFSSFYSYLSLFTASMLGLVVSNNYLQIFIC